MFAGRLVRSRIVVALSTVAPAACVLPAQDASGPHTRPPAKYEVRIEKDLMVPMRDGVRLATDLYLPVGAAEKLPVILIRLPYNKNRYGGAMSPARFFASQARPAIARISYCHCSARRTSLGTPGAAEDADFGQLADGTGRVIPTTT
jgi:hypothetical protein